VVSSDDDVALLAPEQPAIAASALMARTTRTFVCTIFLNLTPMRLDYSFAL
jgi:hypothetical protein